MIECLELFDDLSVIFDGIEISVHDKVEGGVFVLGVIDVVDGVCIFKDVGHFFTELATASDEENLLHCLSCLVRFLFIIIIWLRSEPEIVSG